MFSNQASFSVQHSAESVTKKTRLSQKILHSDGSVSYLTGEQPINTSATITTTSGRVIVPSIGNIKETLPSIHQHKLETSTSRSLVQGALLVSVMVASLVGFILSRIHYCTSYHNADFYAQCLPLYKFYSITSLVCCLIVFLIYFIHLIVQCHIFCLKKNSLNFEILTLSTITVLYMISLGLYNFSVVYSRETFTTVSFIYSLIAILLLIVRLSFLIKESFQERKNAKRISNNSRRSRTKSTNSIRDSGPNLTQVIASSPLNHIDPLNPPKVITYVRNNSRKKTTSTDFVDDEVFIQ